MRLTQAGKHGIAVAASVGLHAALTLGGAWLALHAAGNPQSPPTPAAGEAASERAGASQNVELPAVGEGIAIEESAPDPTGVPPPPPAGANMAHPDTGRAGAGQRTVADSAIAMSEAVSPVKLSPDLVNHLDRDQLQRLRVARRRASWEDRRSTTHPAELSLVVMGDRGVAERRPAAVALPSVGVRASPPPDVRGGPTGGPAALEADIDAPRRGGEIAGGDRSVAGEGLRDARKGLDHRASAPLASARPAVVRAPVAVAATDRARPQDDVETEQEVATAVHAIVHASTAGGSPGVGAGGVMEGGGEPGSGGAGPLGFDAHPVGPDGQWLDFGTHDPRWVSYFRSLHERIDPLWADAFPKSAALNLEQGTVILEFVVFADGSVQVHWPPLRPSGIDEFDRNCARAIRRAAPLPPIPATLGPVLRIRAPFVANNPIVK